MALKFSKPFKIIISIIVAILGIMVFLLLIGYLIDCLTHPSLKTAGVESLEYLMSLQKDDPGNAWDYYSAAIEKSKGVQSDKTWERYLDCAIEITPEILQTIKDSEETIKEIKEGAKQDFCSIPYDYKKGVAIEIPDFMTLRRITEIMCMKSLRELEIGQTEEAHNEILTVATVGKHIASGSPQILDQMIGNVLLAKALNVLEIALSSREFENSELEIISQSLSEIEKNWPMLSSALDGDIRQVKISFASHAFYKPVDSYLLLMYSYGQKPLFFEKLIGRFLCWRYFFSIKLALLRSFIFINTVISEMQIIENEYMKTKTDEEVNTNREESLQERMINYSKKNPVFGLMLPNISSLYGRNRKSLTRVRALHLSCLINSYYLKKRHYPINLREIAGEITVDLNTGKIWEYTNHEDSVVIFSPGVNKTDDKDDISLTISNMGIKKYIEKRRNAEVKKSKK